MTWIESLAVISALIYVITISKGKIIAWLFAGLSSIIYIYICFEAQIYAESVLHFFYLITAILGWFTWKNNSSLNSISLMSFKQHLGFNLGAISLSIFLFYLLSEFTESKLPLIDSFTTIFSMLGTFLIINKKLENWIYFILIDIVSIYLYYSRELYLSSVLFVVYIIIAVYGYLNWKKIYQKQVEL